MRPGQPLKAGGDPGKGTRRSRGLRWRQVVRCEGRLEGWSGRSRERQAEGGREQTRERARPAWRAIRHVGFILPAWEPSEGFPKGPRAQCDWRPCSERSVWPHTVGPAWGGGQGSCCPGPRGRGPDQVVGGKRRTRPRCSQVLGALRKWRGPVARRGDLGGQHSSHQIVVRISLVRCSPRSSLTVLSEP